MKGKSGLRGVGIIIGTLSVHAGAAILSGGVTVLPSILTVGKSVDFALDTFDREGGLREANKFLSVTSKLSVAELAEVKRQTALNQLVHETNRLRRYKKVGPLTEEEIALLDAQAKTEGRAVTAIDLILKKLKLEMTDENYEMVQAEVLRLASEGDAFCPMKSGNNRPMTIKQIVKLMKKKLKS